MVELSEHTKLVNIIAALAMSRKFNFGDVKKENPLWSLGYRLSYIEFTYPGVRPDVILTSRKHSHSLVVDCKRNKVNPRQLQKYIEIREKPTPLLNYITVDSSTDYYVDVAFMSFYNTLCEDTNVNHYKVPVLRVESKTEKKHTLQLECNDFIAKRMHEHLHRIFPLELPEYVVKSYLRAHYIDPTLNDAAECEFFINRVLRTLVSIVVTNKKSPLTISIEALSQKIYHHSWDYISYDKRKEIKTQVKNVVRKILKKTKIKNKIKLENNMVFINIDPNNENAIRNFANQLKRARKTVVFKLCKGQGTLPEYIK